MGIIQTIATIIILVATIAVFAVALRGLKGKRGVNRNGDPIVYSVSAKKRAASITSMVIAGCLFAGTIGVSAATIFKSSGNASPSTNESLAAVPETTPDPTEEPEHENAIETVAHEAITLTQEELDRLTAGHSWRLSRNSMPSNSRFRKILAGSDFSGAVSFTLKMAIDGSWFDEMHGISPTNPKAKVYTPEEIEAYLAEKIQEWVKEYEDLPTEEFYRMLLWRICDEILRNPVFADMVNQFMCSEEYFTRNNEWVLTLRKVFNWAYEQPNGIFSLYEYEEGWNSTSDCASAHIVLKNEVEIDGEKYNVRELLQKTCAMLDDAVVLGVREGMLPTTSWYIPTDSVEADFVRTVPQEIKKSKEADEAAKERSVFLLAFDDKYGGRALLFGFNMEDARVEVFKPETPVTPTEPTPEPTNTPEPTPGPKENPKKEYADFIVHYVDAATNQKVANDHKETLEVGSSYSADSPAVDGYTCRTAKVSGTNLPKEGKEVTVYYDKQQPQKEYADFIVHYVDAATNQKVANDHKETLEVGSSYSADSPAVDGYTCRTAKVSGTNLPKEGKEVTVYYDKQQPQKEYADFIVHYVDAATNQKVANDHKETLEVGSSYSADSPAVDGYTCRTAKVSGTNLPKEGKEVTVYYDKQQPQKEYADFIVHYVDAATNQKVANDHKETLEVGSSYSADSPAVDGYTCRTAKVSGTNLPKEGKEVTVYYDKNTGDGNGDKTPTSDPGQQENAPILGGDNASGNGGNDDGAHQGIGQEKQEEQENNQNAPQEEADRNAQEDANQQASDKADEEESSAQQGAEQEASDQQQPAGTTVDDNNPDSSSGGTTNSNGSPNSGETSGTMNGSAITTTKKDDDEDGNTDSTTTPIGGDGGDGGTTNGELELPD